MLLANILTERKVFASAFQCNNVGLFNYQRSVVIPTIVLSWPKCNRCGINDRCHLMLDENIVRNRGFAGERQNKSSNSAGFRNRLARAVLAPPARAAQLYFPRHSQPVPRHRPRAPVLASPLSSVGKRYRAPRPDGTAKCTRRRGRDEAVLVSSISTGAPATSAGSSLGGVST